MFSTTTLAAVVFTACTLGLGDNDWRTRELAEHRVSLYAAASLDNWSRVRAAARVAEDPEVRDRLARAWKSQANKLVERLLPSTYPLWPDLDRLAEEYENEYGDEDYPWRAHKAAENELRQSFLAHLTAESKRRDTEGEARLHRFKVNAVYPDYRRATARWASFELIRTGDPERVRGMLERACIREANRENFFNAEQLENDPDLIQVLIETFPEITNRRYFDGRRSPRN